MHSFSVSSLVALLVALLGLLKGSSAYGVANLWHWCPYNVYCATVVGCPASTPPGDCPGVSFQKLNQGVNITVPFEHNPSGTGVTIMCTRDPKASPILVTQLEWTWEKGQGLVYYDVSNVAGRPFADNGFVLHAYDPKDPSQKLNRCVDAYCPPGDLSCQGVYEVWNDDLEAMRSCYDDAVLGLLLCTNS